MPLDFTCPHCQARTIVEDEFLGRSGPCFSCGKSVVVPFPASGAVTRVKKAAASNGMWFGVVAVLVSGIIVLILGVTIAIMFVAPAVQTARATARQNACGANLSRIYVALKKYHDEYGTFPPAYVTDANGKPLYSWRVLILPQLNEHLLYQQFHRNSAWDSPENAQFIKRMPSVFGCPSDDSTAQSETSYLAVVGKRTVFPDAESRSLTDIKDSPRDTLLLVECHNSGIAWSEPKDLPATALRAGINTSATAGKATVRSDHPDGAYVLMADGQALALPADTPTDTLDAMSTIQGKEPIPWDMFPGAR